MFINKWDFFFFFTATGIMPAKVQRLNSAANTDSLYKYNSHLISLTQPHTDFD